jgi:hypothetical protein
MDAQEKQICLYIRVRQLWSYANDAMLVVQITNKKYQEKV